MKKLILFALCAFSTLSLFAQQDTVVVLKPEKVVVKNTKDGRTVEIFGSKDNPNYMYTNEIYLSSDSKEVTKVNSDKIDFSVLNFSKNKEKQNKFYLAVGDDLYLGSLSVIDSPKGMGVKHWGSWDWGISLFKLSYTPKPQDRYKHSFSIGIGSSTKYFKTRDKKMIGNTEGQFTLTDYPANAYKRKSRLDVHSLHLTLGYAFYANKVLLSFDVIGNYNYGARSVTKYKMDGGEHKYEKEGFKLKHFTPEYRFSVGTRGGASLYFKYAPNSLLRSSHGPKLSYMSFGIILR